MINEIELHDSELLSVDAKTGTVLIDAYIHRSGADIRQEGGYQKILFTFKNLQVESNSVELSGDIYDWSIASDSLREMI